MILGKGILGKVPLATSGDLGLRIQDLVSQPFIDSVAVTSSRDLTIEDIVSQSFIESVIAFVQLSPEDLVSQRFIEIVTVTSSRTLNIEDLVAQPFIELVEGLPATLDNAGVIYEVLITGVQDGETDVLVPVSNIRATVRNGVNSFLSITIPDIGHAQTFSDRPNADIQISRRQLLSHGFKGDANQFLDFNFSDLRSDEGAVNRSLTITGSKQITFSSPKTVNLTDPITRRVSNGSITYRVKLQDINPGDTAVIGSDSFTVDRVGYFISLSQAYIDLFE